MTPFSFSKWGSQYVDGKLQEYSQNPLQPTRDLLCKIHSCIDLTTLSNADSDGSVATLMGSVRQHHEDYCSEDADIYIPNVAGICVYPKFVPMLRKVIDIMGDVQYFSSIKDIDIVSVAGAFPHAQTFREVKVLEVRMAAEAGADEIDVVINAGDIIENNPFAAYEDLKAMRDACPKCRMKVILETGVYNTDEQIYDAAITAMYAGADFVKTSTGKCSPAATPRAALIMALAVKDYYDATYRKVGIKPAGGIRTSQDALQYVQIVSDILSDDYISKKYFRLGATSLAKNVINDILALG